jgi:hypothetical protein
MNEASVYLQTSSRLRAEDDLSLAASTAASTRIYRLDQTRCEQLLMSVRRQNVFLRVRGDRDFYLRQIQALADRTVIEVQLMGRPAEMLPRAAAVADVAERVVMLAASLAMRKKDYLRALGISSHGDQIGLARSADCMAFSSRTKRRPRARGLLLSRQLTSRVTRAGFDELYRVCILGAFPGPRVKAALDWLVESRCEPRFDAAVVKTAIALESLLSLSERGSIARSLAERTAFLLSSDPRIRDQASRAINRFYQLRSETVHAGRRGKPAPGAILDGVDRLVTLVMLQLAGNASEFPDEPALRKWLNNERWGRPSQLAQPYSGSHVRAALGLCADKPAGKRA